ncbi:MAG TPA: glycoside hydrolase family 2 TIM barrel-domain containing protein [Streptosporangiaceae bacterium]|nr:glycoside hydrolase family 2 TIM barrel-domain containing protein [Streptosporangiaceae bacterium]
MPEDSDLARRPSPVALRHGRAAAGHLRADARSPRHRKPARQLSEATQRSHERVIRELFARDKNHPCVVMWSIANEPESVTQESRGYFAPLVDLARQLDPSRPVAFANVPGADADKDVITDLFEVIMLNRYYGWYMDAGDLAAAERALEANLTAWSAAVFMSLACPVGAG